MGKKKKSNKITQSFIKNQLNIAVGKIALKKKIQPDIILEKMKEILRLFTELRFDLESISRLLTLIEILEVKKQMPDNETIKKLLYSFCGNVYQIALNLQITPQALDQKIKNNPLLNAYREECKTLYVDMAKSVINNHLRENNLTSAIFVLKTQGGWNEKNITEIQQAQPASIIFQPFDFSHGTETKPQEAINAEYEEKQETSLESV